LFETIEWYRATKTRPPIPAESSVLEQSA